MNLPTHKKLLRSWLRPLFVAAGLLSAAANAALLEISVSGTLTSGSQRYADSFNLGTGVAYADLTGKDVSFRWLIDTDLLGTNEGDGTTTTIYRNCVNGVCNPSRFLQAEVTINGVTRGVPDIGGQWIEIHDSTGGYPNGADILALGEYYEFYDRHKSGEGASISLWVYDYFDSLFTGVGVEQLNGWSTATLDGNDGDTASFSFFSYQIVNGEQLFSEGADGTLRLNGSTLTWGPGYQPPTSVPEPMPLALFGLGLAVLAVKRRRAR